jgi:DNA-binding NtrC family response regulator
LRSYSWPGNIRELRNIVERLSILVSEPVIEILDLPEAIRGEADDTGDFLPASLAGATLFRERSIPCSAATFAR